MVLRAALAAASLLILSTGSLAAASDQTVNVVYPNFTPASFTIALGGTVTWHNAETGTLDHTSTSNLGGYWSRNLPDHGANGVVLMDAAGTYAYHCAIHPNMTGKVAVKMAASPTSGTAASTIFNIQWAEALADLGWGYDVQKRKKGGTFKTWKSGVSATHAFFDPTKTGKFQFRMRLRHGSVTSAYSPILTITVN
jgi:plastocyanin